MRTTSSMGTTHTLPSPILPVRAVSTSVSRILGTSPSSARISSRTLGTKSISYSAPRYTSVCPRWRPKPCTSETVRPCTPRSFSAFFTSSSLNGLMMPTISFMAILSVRAQTRSREYPVSECCVRSRPVSSSSSDARMPFGRTLSSTQRIAKVTTNDHTSVASTAITWSPSSSALPPLMKMPSCTTPGLIVASAKKASSSEPLDRQPAEHRGRGGHVGVHERLRGEAVGAERGARIEAEPAEPQDPRAEQRKRQIVRKHRVIGPAAPLAEQDHRRERGDARIDVHDGAAGEVERAAAEEPAGG